MHLQLFQLTCKCGHLHLGRERRGERQARRSRAKERGSSAFREHKASLDHDPTCHQAPYAQHTGPHQDGLPESAVGALHPTSTLGLKLLSGVTMPVPTHPCRPLGSAPWVLVHGCASIAWKLSFQNFIFFFNF